MERTEYFYGRNLRLVQPEHGMLVEANSNHQEQEPRGDEKTHAIGEEPDASVNEDEPESPDYGAPGDNDCAKSLFGSKAFWSAPHTAGDLTTKGFGSGSFNCLKCHGAGRHKCKQTGSHKWHGWGGGSWCSADTTTKDYYHACQCKDEGNDRASLANAKRELYYTWKNPECYNKIHYTVSEIIQKAKYGNVLGQITTDDIHPEYVADLEKRAQVIELMERRTTEIENKFEMIKNKNKTNKNLQDRLQSQEDINDALKIRAAVGNNRREAGRYKQAGRHFPSYSWDQ